MRNLTIAILLALLLWFGSAIIRLERYRYAAMLGMCDRHSGELRRAKREQCLENTETRTNPLWHLAYGLRLI
ncbi:hypothetical protein [Sphingomonas turrisvirgatae]|uniref:Uncharacterized protein n=1 Tax=Sphingomonas turrisvirgatae TaxID=1888892 RepID=A0A1E3LQZ9_9SPHN|nr:hypothetical protein [Sphingomonas turrisvirgatae]ODP36192.1 hypothetical protein BFL28_07225 [Sphingomonas turrisvirgatae]